MAIRYPYGYLIKISNWESETLSKKIKSMGYDGLWVMTDKGGIL